MQGVFPDGEEDRDPSHWRWEPYGGLPLPGEGWEEGFLEAGRVAGQGWKVGFFGAAFDMVVLLGREMVVAENMMA